MALIMEDVAEAVVFVALTAGEKLGLIKKQGSNSGGESAGGSASSSPNNNDG